MTLNQYYELIIRDFGYRSWNHYCADVTPEAKESFKKDYKRQFKKLSWDELELLEEEYKKLKTGENRQ